MANLGVFWYGRGVQAVQDGTVDWLGATIRVALLGTGYTPDQGGHRFFADVAANEAAGPGYTAGGQELTGKTRDYDAVNRRVVLGGNDLSWDPSTLAAQYAVIYADTGDPATSPLLGYGDSGAEQTSDGAAFNVAWHPDGILRITAAPQE